MFDTQKTKATSYIGLPDTSNLAKNYSHRIPSGVWGLLEENARSDDAAQPTGPGDGDLTPPVGVALSDGDFFRIQFVLKNLRTNSLRMHGRRLISSPRTRSQT